MNVGQHLSPCSNMQDRLGRLPASFMQTLAVLTDHLPDSDGLSKKRLDDCRLRAHAERWPQDQLGAEEYRSCPDWMAISRFLREEAVCLQDNSPWELLTVLVAAFLVDWLSKFGAQAPHLEGASMHGFEGK